MVASTTGWLIRLISPALPIRYAALVCTKAKQLEYRVYGLNQARSLHSNFISQYITQHQSSTPWVLYGQASRAISTGQLHASLHFHIQPINVLVSNGSLGTCVLGDLILR